MTDISNIEVLQIHQQLHIASCVLVQWQSILSESRVQPPQGARIETKLDELDRKEAIHNIADDALVAREPDAPRVQGLMTIGTHPAHPQLVAADQTAQKVFDERLTPRGQLAL